MPANNAAVLAAYLVFISLLSAILTVTDKKRAKAGKRRISERALLLCAFFGGALAEYAVMKLIRHKTRHRRFMAGLPAIMLFHLTVAAVVLIST